MTIIVLSDDDAEEFHKRADGTPLTEELRMREVRFSCTRRGTIRLDFATPVEWALMTPDDADATACILRRLAEAQRARSHRTNDRDAAAAALAAGDLR